MGKKWCADNGVRYCDSAQEVVASCDALMALAPNNFEKHLEVAGPALTSGKPLYIDKLLAHTPENAEEIAVAAKKAKTPIMCCSALRFAPELDELDKRIKGQPTGIFARGYGQVPGYAVHTLALVMRYFGPDVKRVVDTGDASSHLITLDGAKGRATIEVRDAKNAKDVLPWQIGVTYEGKCDLVTIKDFEGFYANEMKRALEFFRTGKSPVSIEEQYVSVQILAAAAQSLAEASRWVEIKPSERLKA